MKLKNFIFKFLPRSWYVAYVDSRNYRYKNMDTQQVFEEVYRKKLWSEGEFKQEDYHSGSGTTNRNTKLYIDFVVKFLKEKQIRDIVEVGCGDFRIMQQVLQNSSVTHYHGTDVVPGLIKRNQSHYGISGKIEFSCVNAVTDALPAGECLIIRQVLQHLDNQQIQAILVKTSAYRYVLITEHIATNNPIPNKDKTQGPETRLKDNSGVFIEKAPFNITNATTVCSYDENYDFMGGEIEAVIRTSLIDNTQVNRESKIV